MSERLDDLLFIALEGGELPADATEEERREVAHVLEARAFLGRTAAEVDDELTTAMPVAPSPLPAVPGCGDEAGSH